MDILINLLIAFHLLGLVVGMGSGIALSLTGPMYGKANDDQRSQLFKLGNLLSRNGHVGLALLWVTGPIVIFLKYGGFGALSPWFWVKIVLAVILSASIGIGSAAYRKFQAGDMGASARVAMTGKINLVCGLLIILTAVFAFG